VNAIQTAVHELKGLASLGEGGSTQGAAARKGLKKIKEPWLQVTLRKGQ